MKRRQAMERSIAKSVNMNMKQMRILKNGGWPAYQVTKLNGSDNSPLMWKFAPLLMRCWLSLRY